MSSAGARFGVVSPSLASEAPPPRVQQQADVAAAIAAARLAASRGSVARDSQGTEFPTPRSGELYADCASLRWRLWAQEAARDGSVAQTVSEERLSPQVANFAAHLLWEHDRAILDAERSSAAALAARGEAEVTEAALFRTEAALAASGSKADPQAQTSIGAEVSALRMSCTHAWEKLESLQHVEERCAKEHRHMLVRCEEAEAECRACENAKGSAYSSLLQAESMLERTHQVFALQAARVENLQTELRRECEANIQLTSELAASGQYNATADIENLRSDKLISEVCEMKDQIARQREELHDMRSHDDMRDGSLLLAATGGTLSPRQSTPIQSPREKSCSTTAQGVAGSSPSTSAGPSLVTSAGGTSALEREIGGLHTLVKQLAEELGNMHTAHAGVVVEFSAARADFRSEQLAAQARVQKTEAENEALVEEVRRLRIGLGHEALQANQEMTIGSPGYQHTSRVGGPQGFLAQDRHLAEALARENRRLRAATRAAKGTRRAIGEVA